MFDALIPLRSAEDVASGVVRVRLGKQTLVLDELPMDAMDAWSASVDRQLGELLAKLDEGDAVGDVMAALAAARPLVLETLCSYPGIPPAETLRATATHAEVLTALMGVWSAANPLVAALVEALKAASQIQQTPSGDVSALMSTLRRASDGPFGDFDPNSPTPSSPSDSTPPTNGSPSRTKPTSKPAASGRSSAETASPTPSGSDESRRPAARPAVASPART